MTTCIWAWKRRRRGQLLLALGTLLVAVVSVRAADIITLEPAYDCQNGRGTDPVISITLNGGPNEWTTQILDILRAANVIATFFVEPDLFVSSATLQQTLKQMVADGHTVACHSTGSQDNNLCRTQLIKVIGYHPVLRRPLTLDDIADEVADARTNGQVVALWNYDFGDWDRSRTEGSLVQQYRQTLSASFNRTLDAGTGINKRYGSFIVVLQNGDRIVQKFTMPNGLQTTILAEVLNGSKQYSFVSIADCLKIKSYSAYSTPDQSTSSSSTSNTVLFAIVFAGLFGLLAIAAVLYTSARRKLHQKARQKEEQRELSRAAIGVMVSQGLFKGDRRDFEQSIPEDSGDVQSDAQRLRHLTPIGTGRTPQHTRRTKKDFHDLSSAHYSMAVNPHGHATRHHKRQQRIVYSGSTTPQVPSKKRPGPASAFSRRYPLRRKSDPIFGSEEEEVFPVEIVPARPLPLLSGPYRPPVRQAQPVLPFQQPFEYGMGNV